MSGMKRYKKDKGGVRREWKEGFKIRRGLWETGVSPMPPDHAGC